MTDTPPQAGQPAWLPDPTGRHEYRWFDGASFTDRVSDAGVMGVDAQAATPPTAPAAPTAFTTTAAPLATTPAPPQGRSRRGLVLGLAGAGVVLVGVGAYLVLSSDDDDGTGTIEGQLESSAPVAVHTVSLEAGDALTVAVSPVGDLDAVIGFLVDEETADILEEAYDDVVDLQRQDLEDVFDVDADALGTTADQVLLRTDLGFPGEEELLLLAAPEAMEVGVVVGPFEPGTDLGTYEIVLERFALDVEEGAAGEELLDAVADDDEVPEQFADLAEELRIEPE